MVIVRDCFGNGVPRRVRVEEIDSNIKNNLPGIEYDDSWAYLHQIDRVVQY
jgi:hypothetical protein